MNLYSRVKAIEKKLRVNEQNRLGRVRVWTSKQEYLQAEKNGETNKYSVNIIDNIIRK